MIPLSLSVLISMYSKEKGNIKNIAKIMWLCRYYKSYIDIYNDSFIWVGTDKIQFTEQFLSILGEDCSAK